MALTTTHRNACDVAVWLDNAAGVLKDISGSSNSVTLALSQNIGETRVFGSRWVMRKVCGKDCKITLVIVYSTAADEGADILQNWYNATDPGARTLKVYFPNKNVGSDVYSGEFMLESYEFPATAGEGAPMLVTANLLIDGEMTYSVAAT